MFRLKKSKLLILFYCLLVSQCFLSAVDYSWAVDANGNWSENNNWDPNTGFPNGAADTASLSNPITENRTITLTEFISLPDLLVSQDNFKYTISNNFLRVSSQMSITGANTPLLVSSSLSLGLPTNISVANGVTLDVSGHITSDTFA